MASNPTFMRHFIGDTPGAPQGGHSMSDCPDIYVAGGAPLAAPGTELTTPASYGTDPPNALEENVANYLYLRATNTSSAEISGRVWLWFAEETVLLWPHLWRGEVGNHPFVYGGKAQNWVDLSIKPTQVVASDAFEFNPPATATHYCLVAMTETPPQGSGPPVAPPKPPVMNTMEEFSQWIENNPNVVWRNTNPQPVTLANFTVSGTIVGPPAGGRFQPGVSCSNMPEGSKWRCKIAAGHNAKGEPYPGWDSHYRTIAEPDEVISANLVWPPETSAVAWLEWWEEGHPREPSSVIAIQGATLASDLVGWLDDPYAGAVESWVQMDPHDPKSAEIQYLRICGAIPFKAF
jgi:hypothetical protein